MTKKAIWFDEFPLDLARRMAAGSIMEQLGIEVTEAGDDYLCGRMPVDRRTVHPAGVLHGGASVALAETLGSFGGWLCIAPGEGHVVGLEINANHLRAVREGEVAGTARPIHLGRSTQVWETRIVDAQERLVCLSRLTLAVVPERAGA